MARFDRRDINSLLKKKTAMGGWYSTLEEDFGVTSPRTPPVKRKLEMEEIELPPASVPVSKPVGSPTIDGRAK